MADNNPPASSGDPSLPFEVFITKNCLVANIRKRTVTRDVGNYLVDTRPIGAHYNCQYSLGSNAFLTLEEAIAAAELVRAAVIKKTQKKIDKLVKIKFRLTVRGDKS